MSSQSSRPSFPHALFYQAENGISIRNGFLHGVLYGTRIRVVDAVVKTLLFSYDVGFAEVVNTVTNIAYDHGSSLGLNVALVKVGLWALRKLTPGGHERPWHWFVSGCFSGSVVWGRKGSFHDLMNMYVMSRVIFAFSKELARTKPLDFSPDTRQVCRRIWAGVMWGLVLYQFHMKYPLTKSLHDSMLYLYKDSRKKTGNTWRDNLGSGADWFPMVAAIVWLLKAFPLERVKPDAGGGSGMRDSAAGGEPPPEGGSTSTLSSSGGYYSSSSSEEDSRSWTVSRESLDTTGEEAEVSSSSVLTQEVRDQVAA
eukprot:CAMPEP_0178989758 /NCGR_PEP_ID=MMETSP0795-20121207/4556_1 /TAXON_ID=88552 /ORGANISM="Amoebophrya sp., Strain Ameob2" /LENGTH=310 /DNA_ID=CAMNT_0020681203 /DNA_START=29 /DNA_END=960 /DNA_ORIENTATION=+